MSEKNDLIIEAIKQNELIMVDPEKRTNKFFSKIDDSAGKVLTDYFSLLFNDSDVQPIIKAGSNDAVTNTNYVLRKTFLDNSAYKNDYATASLFGVINPDEWDKNFATPKQLEKNLNNYPIYVLEPKSYTYKTNITDAETVLESMNKNIGIISQGDQFTFLELRPTILKNEQGKPMARYTIEGIIDTVKKPKKLLPENSGENSIAFTKTGNRKIIEQIYTLDENGKKVVDTSDFYEIMKNYVLGSVNAMTGDDYGYEQKKEHLRRAIATNLEVIDATSSVAFLTSQTNMTATGMSMKAYYNTESSNLILDESMFNQYLKGLFVEREVKGNNNPTAALKKQLYNMFNVKNESQKTIIESILKEQKHGIYDISSNNNKTMISIDINSFIQEYTSKVNEVLKNSNSNYYNINVKDFATSLNFSNSQYNLNFNLGRHFKAQRIGDNVLKENYLLKTDKYLHALTETHKMDKTTVMKYLDNKITPTLADEMKNIFKKNKEVAVNKIINSISNSTTITNDDRLKIAEMFTNFFKDEYAKAYGFSNYNMLENNLDNYAVKPLNFSANFVYGMLSNKKLLDTWLSTGKQSANIRGKKLKISQSGLDLFGHLNVAGQRASQGGDKFSSAVLNVGGDKLNFGKIISSWQQYDPLINQEVVNTNVKAYSEVAGNFYKTATDNKEFETNLFSNLTSILYTNSDYAFQDSNATSTLHSMKTISMYDNKNLTIGYDSIDKNVIDEITKQFNLDGTSGFFKRISQIDESQIVNEGTFEHVLYKKILGENNFEKYVRARYNADGSEKNLIKEFAEIGSELKEIKSVQTVDEKKRMIQAVEKSVVKYNQFINDYMIHSDSDGKQTQVLGKGFLYPGYNLSISGANETFIEKISFGNDGIRIKTKGLLVNTQGVKMMYDNIKATNQRSSHLLGIVDNGVTHVIDGLVNEKMTKGKRGFNGTFYGRSILTMSLHGMMHDFADNNQLNKEQKLNRFLEIMKTNSTIEINGQKTNVLDLLGIDISLNNGVLEIGEIDKKTKKFKALLTNATELNSAQSYLNAQMNKRMQMILGRIPNAEDANNIGSLIVNKLYGAYNEYLGQLSDVEKEKAKIFFSNSAYLERSFISSSDNVKEYGIKKVHNIDEGGAYRFFSFGHLMKETKALADEEAVKFTRLTNIVLAENGLEWLAEELSNSVADNVAKKSISDITLLPNSIGRNLFGEDEYNEMVENLFKNNIIDLNNSVYEDTNNGFKFITKSTLGQMLDYDSTNNALKESFYGSLTNFNPKLKKELDDFYKTMDSKSNASDIALEYLIRNMSEYNFRHKDKKEEEVAELIRRAKIELNGQMQIMNNGDFNQFIKNVFGYDSLNEISTSTRENFIGLFNQFVMANHNINEVDYSKIQYNFNKKDINILNTIYKQKYKDSSISFGNLLNQYSGEKLINFKALQDIIEEGTMKFKITNFAIDGVGEIVYNDEISRINKIINNNKKMNDLENVIHNFKENDFKTFGNKQQYNDLYNIYAKSNGELETPINFSDFVIHLDTEEKVEKHKKFLKNLKTFIHDASVNPQLEDKKERYNKILEYINKVSFQQIPDTENPYSEQLIKAQTEVRNFIKDKNKIKQFVDNVDYNLFSQRFLNNVSFYVTNTLGHNNNELLIDVQDFIKDINLNVSNNKLNFASSSISKSLLESEGILTTTQNTFNSISQLLFDSEGKLKKQLSIKEIENVMNSFEHINAINFDETEKEIAKQFISRSQKYIKNQYVDKIITGLPEYGNKPIILYNNMMQVAKKSYEMVYKKNISSTISAIAGYAPESNFMNRMYYQPKKSATIQGAEGSSIAYHIKNSFEEIIGLDPKTEDYRKKVKEFKEAMALVYGDFRNGIIDDIINKKDVEMLDKFVSGMSGVIIGDIKEYEKIGMSQFFGNRHYTYGFLSRNPHQYVGSIRASRMVAIDDTNRNLSFLKYFIGEESKINTQSKAFNFIGKRTAIGMNGDFDGDRYQLFKIIDSDFRLTSTKKRIAYKKINLDTEIGYLLNDLSIYDLEKEFQNGNKLSNDRKQLFNLIRKRANYDQQKITSNEAAFNYIKDRYKALKFEYLRAQEVVEDENAQHAALPSLNDLVIKFKNGNTEKINRGEFSEFILSLKEEEKKELLYKIVNQNDAKQLDQIFDTTLADKQLVKKIKDFQNANKEYQENHLYQIIRDLNDEVTKGNLKFNNVWLSDTGYEAYTGIHRTGPVHSAFTQIREVAAIAKEDITFNSILRRIFEKGNLSDAEGVEITKQLSEVREVLKKTTLFNTYGTIIEKLSISSKLGGGADPYLNMNKIRETTNIIEKKLDLETLQKSINFNQILDVINQLSDNMNGKEFQYKGKSIETINDIVRLMTNKDADLTLIENMKESIAVLLNKSFTAKDYDIANLKLKNNDLLSIFSNASMLLSKGYLFNFLGTETGLDNSNFYNATKNTIESNGLLHGIIKYFNKESAPGFRYEMSLFDRIKAFTGKKISSIIHKKQSAQPVIEKQIQTDIGAEQAKIVPEPITQATAGKTNATHNIIQDIEQNKVKEETIVQAVDKIIDEENISAVEKDINEITKTTEEISNSSEAAKAPELYKEIETLNEEVQNLKGQELETAQIKTTNENLTEQLKATRHSIDEIEANAQNKLDNAQKEIEQLKNKLEKANSKINELKNSLSETISKKTEEVSQGSKKILDLQKHIKDLEEQIEQFSKATNKTSLSPEQVAEATSETKIAQGLSKHKKMLMYGGAAAALGLFFRIFQSNRSVVELDINQEQYEETKGSIYRTLGNYNINTNIRSFY